MKYCNDKEGQSLKKSGRKNEVHLPTLHFNKEMIFKLDSSLRPPNFC